MTYLQKRLMCGSVYYQEKNQKRLIIGIGTNFQFSLELSRNVTSWHLKSSNHLPRQIKGYDSIIPWRVAGKASCCEAMKF